MMAEFKKRIVSIMLVVLVVLGIVGDIILLIEIMENLKLQMKLLEYKLKN